MHGSNTLYIGHTAQQKTAPILKSKCLSSELVCRQHLQTTNGFVQWSNDSHLFVLREYVWLLWCYRKPVALADDKVERDIET